MSRITLNDIEASLGGHGARVYLARCTGVSPQAVVGWWRRGRIPAKHSPTIARLTGYSIEQVIKARNENHPQ